MNWNLFIILFIVASIYICVSFIEFDNDNNQICFRNYKFAQLIKIISLIIEISFLYIFDIKDFYLILFIQSFMFLIADLGIIFIGIQNQE